MSFHDVRFPDDISYGSAGGPGFRTDVIQLQGGAERRISRWTDARRRYNVAYGVRSYEQLHALTKFFIARKGAESGFRYKDFIDFTTASDGRSAHAFSDVVIGVGTGSAVNFQLKKYYESGGVVRTRNISHPVGGTVLIGVNGSEVSSEDYSISSLGVVTFDAAPSLGHSVTAGFEFDVPVRFETSTDDFLRLSLDDFGSGSAQNVDLIELIGDDLTAEEFYYGGAKIVNPMSSDLTLTFLDGRAISVAPDSGSLKIVLPDPALGALGGPHFVIKNTSGSNAVAVHYPSGTSLASIAAGAGKLLMIGLTTSAANEWVVI